MLNTTVNSMLYEWFFGFRRMFYMVTPNETAFENVAQTPNYVDQSKIWFAIFMIVELIYDRTKSHGTRFVALSDSITSIGAGLLQGTMKTLFRYVELTFGQWIYANYHIIDLPWDSIWTWILAFICVDLSYYWFHRSAHEVNLIWAFHHVHHTSEYYNYSTALRQGMFQQYGSMWFYLPQCLFVPPSIHMAHMTLSLLYQFSLHTRMVGKLGWFVEGILNTPSHHRVHHSRNAYCLNKNFGGYFIIWDKLFGTYQDEYDDEPLQYGLVDEQLNFNQMAIQAHYFRTIWSHIKEADSIWMVVNILFNKPGWFETQKNKDQKSSKLSSITFERKPLTSGSGWRMHVYIYAQLLVSTYLFNQFARQRQNLSWFDCMPYVLFAIMSTTCFGQFYNKSIFAPLYETMRCASFCFLFNYVTFETLNLRKSLQMIFMVQAFYWCYCSRKIIDWPCTAASWKKIQASMVKLKGL